MKSQKKTTVVTCESAYGNKKLCKDLKNFHIHTFDEYYKGNNSLQIVQSNSRNDMRMYMGNDQTDKYKQLWGSDKQNGSNTSSKKGRAWSSLLWMYTPAQFSFPEIYTTMLSSVNVYHISLLRKMYTKFLRFSFTEDAFPNYLFW